MKQPYLVAHIQVLDRCANFLNRAHTNSLAEISSMRRGMRRRRQEIKKEEGKIMNWDVEISQKDELRRTLSDR